METEVSRDPRGGDAIRSPHPRDERSPLHLLGSRTIPLIIHIAAGVDLCTSAFHFHVRWVALSCNIRYLQSKTRKGFEAFRVL